MNHSVKVLVCSKVPSPSRLVTWPKADKRRTSKTEAEERARLAEIIHNFEDSLFDELITLLNFGDSLSYTEILIQNHLERAMLNLDYFPDCDAKQLLKHLVELIKNRHK